jgi:hypothetical protein
MKSRAPTALAIILTLAPRAADGSEAIQHLTIHASLQTATALQVSAHTLVFEVDSDGGTAVSSVDFVASARTTRSGEVILSVDAARNLEGLDSWTLTLGEAGTPLPANGPIAAERWIGGGTRSGRVMFTLRAAAAGRYVVPVRLSLATP